MWLLMSLKYIRSKARQGEVKGSFLSLYAECVGVPDAHIVELRIFMTKLKTGKGHQLNV